MTGKHYRDWEVVQRGNPSIMGAYTYTVSDKVSNGRARKAYNYALYEIKEYADGVSDDNVWKKWRILHALEKLNPAAIIVTGKQIGRAHV